MTKCVCNKIPGSKTVCNEVVISLQLTDLVNYEKPLSINVVSHKVTLGKKERDTHEK